MISVVSGIARTIMRELLLQKWSAVQAFVSPATASFRIFGELGETVATVQDSAVVIHIVQMHNEALRLAEEGPEVASFGGEK